MTKPTKTIDDVRQLLVLAITDSGRSAAWISVNILKRNNNYLRDFLNPNKKTGEYKKNTLGAEDRDELERFLKLTRGDLATGITRSSVPSMPLRPDSIDLQLFIEEALRLGVQLGNFAWRETDYPIAAELIQQLVLKNQGSATDAETRRKLLELDIRRALQNKIQ